MALRIGRRRRPLGPRGHLLVGGLSGLMGLLAIGLGYLRPVYRQQAAQAWVATPCVVLASEVRQSTRKGHSKYRPSVSFRYQVDGASHQSSEYALTDLTSSDPARARAVVAALAPGTNTTCYVDPRDPDEAVLVREIDDIWLPLGLGILLLGFSLFLVLRGIRLVSEGDDAVT